MKNIIVNLGGGITERRQALGTCLLRLPKGGQRHSVEIRRLIDIGGDSYGK